VLIQEVFEICAFHQRVHDYSPVIFCINLVFNIAAGADTKTLKGSDPASLICDLISKWCKHDLKLMQNLLFDIFEGLLLDGSTLYISSHNDIQFFVDHT